MTSQEILQRAKELDEQLARMSPYKRARIWQRVERELLARRCASKSVKLSGGCTLIKPARFQGGLQ